MSPSLLCVICLEDVHDGRERIKLRCNHVFHAHCIESWLQTVATCPVCRRCFMSMSVRVDALKTVYNLIVRSKAKFKRSLTLSCVCALFGASMSLLRGSALCFAWSIATSYSCHLQRGHPFLKLFLNFIMACSETLYVFVLSETYLAQAFAGLFVCTRLLTTIAFIRMTMLLDMGLYIVQAISNGD